MLKIQRASAGSGKTYTLTRHFIRLFISIPVEEGSLKRRLRTRDELRDSHSHILAITFTNKATDEMKERIVTRLHALAHPAPDETPDYMADFCTEFGCEPEKISAVCRDALSVLLSDYSDFQVSTIDSFFQTILRTFAFESDLNDAYQVELDSDYISRMGIDLTMASIDGSRPDPEVKKWLEKIMEELRKKGTSWNLLQKSENRNSAYMTLNGAAAIMKSEEFKKRRDDLDHYFSANPDFSKIFLSYDDYFSRYPQKAFESWKTTVNDFRAAVEALSDGERQAINSSAISQLEKCLSCKSFTEMPSFSWEKIRSKNSVLKAKPKLSESVGDAIDKAAMAMYNGRENFLNSDEYRLYNLWMIYRPKLLYLGLLKSIRGNALKYLEENNTVELAETNMLLRKIIGNNETPFIYEKLGTRVNHYLIDEFQDTSKMQWHNISPLLHETEARGAENLIIGDAKQSIYRFRNAAVELITTVVPKEFPRHISAGDSAEENTNRRSKRNVVLFNNTVFHHLAEYIDREIMPQTLRQVANLYSNAVQPPAETADSGYVKVSFPAPGNAYISEMGPLVHELLNRGYRQREIAFLVPRRDQGQEIINSFIDYNRTLAPDLSPVEFISEDSLTLKESRAVQTVISALEVIRSGTAVKLKDGEDNKDYGPGRAADLGYNFSFYCSSHPELSFEEQIQNFLANPDPASPLSEMLAEMKTMTLPSIVEGIIARFVPDDLRRADAPFLSALQDCVLDYCENYTADVASFLRWWDAKKNSLSINSPEDADAVRVMTIHKSKGLEFKCVILPYANTDLTFWNSNHPETIWVHPGLPVPPATNPLPDEIPVDAVKNLEGTVHEQETRKAAAAALIDKLNSVYVAFTRASRELHVYCPAGSKNSTTSLTAIFRKLLDTLNSPHAAPDNHLLPDGAIRVTESDDVTIWETGTLQPYTAMQREEEEKKKKISTGGKEYLIGNYDVNPKGADIKYREAEPMVTNGEDSDEDTDPRSEGNLLHLAMADIRTQADISRAVQKLCVQGLISSPTADRFRQILRDAVSKHPEWFGPKLRILNERTLFINRRQRRADRIVITPEGDAVIIDFKFGEQREDHKYSSQVRRYMKSVKATGKYRSVKGYVWYVMTDEIMEVNTASPAPPELPLFD